MMTRSLVTLVGALLIAAPLAVLAKQPTHSKSLDRKHHRIEVNTNSYAPDGSLDPRAGRSLSAAAAETTFLATYSFDQGGGCAAEGWVGVDITAQLGEYFHVDDFAGLGGGDFGRLNPLEGNQSLWCGARPGSGPVLCGYAVLPGYGNNWNQSFCTTSCQSVDGDVLLTFLMAWDSEPGYDYTHIEYDECDENWITLASFDGIGADLQSIVVLAAEHDGAMRLRFNFTSDGAWSDEDALWDTDGAVIIDSLTVSDVTGTVLPTETFETEAVGAQATASGNWESCSTPGYGDFSALFPGVTMVQEDPCLANLSCLWAFISGSTVNYACGGYPSQLAVPYGNLRDQYLSNEIWSPEIPWVGSGLGADLRFDVYRDLPLDPLIFYVWHVRWWLDSCPGPWMDTNFVFFGGGKDWHYDWHPIGFLAPPVADSIQLALGAVDMCPFWCGVFGLGACHSHAPLFDNVTVYRYDSNGPQWNVRDIDLFQDNFAGDGTVTGTVRADMAIDILPNWSVNEVLPGDSAVVDVSDAASGLAGDAHSGSGPAVYAYVTVWPDGSKFGPDVASGDQSNNGYQRYPLVDSLEHEGKFWYCVRFDTVFTDGNQRTGMVKDRYCVDLNDDSFTPGDTVCFVFCAENNSGLTTYYTQAVGVTEDLSEALNSPMEFTCLPAGGWLRGGDILYVDGMNERGAQPFFDEAFDAMDLLDKIDRYDIRGPSSNAGNRPGSRVTNVEQQLLACYRKIIWSTGNLSDGLIGDGTNNPEKSDDASMLYQFLDGLDNPGGVYFSGDDIANELSQLTGAGAINLRSKFINYSVVNDDHVAQGLGINPWVIGEVGGCFDHVTGPDRFVAFGGCPLINNFDVLFPQGTAALEASYEHYSTGTSGGAIVSQQTLNSDSTTVGVILSGFSFHYIRDDGEPASYGLDRWEHMRDILLWLGNEVPILIGADEPSLRRNRLAQNYPNPFNPTTTIEFEVRERARAQVSVYNVAGQLVKRLLDEERAPGVVHKLTWDGRNDAGAAVSSGVYFYRISAPGFTKTRKMVLLK